LDLDQLLRAARDGDKAAEQSLFRTLSVRFRLIAYRILRDQQAADDVAQESALDVLRAYRSLEVKESFAAWARVVVRNRALTYLETRKRQESLAATLAAARTEQSGGQGSRVLQKRILECLLKISRTDRRYGRIINLRHQGYTIEQICQKLSITANNAYVILHRARRALRACLDNVERSS
jgi:RNA polymerase sigma-70 factor (ECF subfamily)